ncbi:MAG TPA: ATP-binding protein [Thermoanaerobaculia bacterium]|nr:ATP-binding protein [Thermoanaerobaculia bacterium]
MILRSRFLWKLFAGIAFIVLVTASVIGLLVRRQVEAEAHLELERRLAGQVSLARAILAEDVIAGNDVQARVRQLAGGSAGDGGTDRDGLEQGTRFRLTVIDADGRVIADSDIEPRIADDHGNRPEVLAAKSLGVGSAVRQSASLGRDLMYVAVPVTDPSGALRGYVRAATSLAAVQSRLGAVRATIYSGALVAATIGLGVAFLFARRVAAPLVGVAAVADAIERGDYRRRVQVSSRDEIGRLATAFNRASAQIADQLETITKDRNQLTAILAGMVEGLIAVDEKDRILLINRVGAELLGADPAEDFVGRPLYEATRVPQIAEALQRARESGATVDDEATLGEGRRRRYLDLHATPLKGGGGRVVGAIVVLHDVTQLHGLENVRRQFVSNVSHELKTPLTAIRGYVETLLDADEVDAETRNRFLMRINSQTSRLSTLVSDLLSLSRIEAGDDALERRLLDLRAPLMESLRALRPAAEARRIRLEVGHPDAPVVVLGEEEAIRQAFSNLIDNAIKYTDEGGHVSVQLGVDGRRAVVAVTDDGMGIDARHLQRIFERFYRVDRARSRELGGTGLGLAIVKNVAQALGGEVTVSSTAGQGSCFRMLLPLATPTGEADFAAEPRG